MSMSCVAATLLLGAGLSAAQGPPPGSVYTGHYTGEIIPTPRYFTKVDDPIPLARRGAATAEACIVVPLPLPSPVRMAAEELRARIAWLLGPDAPELPVLQGFAGVETFASVITLGIPEVDQTVPGDLPDPLPSETYYISADVGGPGWVSCWGESPTGTYLGAQSLVQLTFERDGVAYLQRASIIDWPAFEVRSFKIGGQDWDLIREMGRWCGQVKYNCFNVCYTTVGTDQWKNPSPEYRQGIQDLCEYRVPRGLDVMPFVNPYYLWGEHIVTSDDTQIDRLADTCAIGLEHGARKVMLCLDDFASEKIPYTIRSEADRERFESLGHVNAHLVNELHRRLDARFPDYELFFVPPYYWIPPGHYQEEGEADLRVTGQSIPEEVHIVWTGPVVRSKRITEENVREYSDLIGRAPFLWDNTLYMHHTPTSYLFDEFVTEYPDRFWELNDAGIHYNAGGGEVYKVGLMTTADYLWNPAAYDPEQSLRRALRQVTGSEEAAKACLAFRDAYYAIYDTYKPVLDSLLPLADEESIPYRPFDAADVEAIQADIKAVTDAQAQVAETSLNQALAAELAERAESFGKYSSVLTRLAENAVPDEDLVDVAVNGGAEEATETGDPVGWGTYTGAGTARIGTSEEDPAEGERCATLEAPEWYDLSGRDWINVAILLGSSNGFTGLNADEARPLTKYQVRFRIRGDVPKAEFSAVGWSGDGSESRQRQALFCRLSEVQVTPEWREHEASFTTALDTERLALKFGIVGYRDEGAELGRIYVDDVRVMVGP